MTDNVEQSNAKKNGRRTNEITIYNYPEHLNPFYKDDQHRRLRFWKMNKNGIAEKNRNNSFTNGLKSICARFSNQNRKSSSLGVNRTSESPPETPTQKKSSSLEIQGKLDNPSQMSNRTETSNGYRQSSVLLDNNILKNTSECQSRNETLTTLSSINTTKTSSFKFSTADDNMPLRNPLNLSVRNTNSNKTEIKLGSIHKNFHKTLSECNNSAYKANFGSSLENLRIIVQNDSKAANCRCHCKFCGNVWTPGRSEITTDRYQSPKPRPEKRHIIRPPMNFEQFELNNIINEKRFFEKLTTSVPSLTYPSTCEQTPVADFSIKYDSSYINVDNFSKQIEYYKNASASSDSCSQPWLINFQNKLSNSSVENKLNEIPEADICNEQKIDDNGFMECIHIHVFKKPNQKPEEVKHQPSNVISSVKKPRKKVRTKTRKKNRENISSSSSAQNNVETNPKYRLKLTRENLLRNTPSISKDVVRDYLSQGPFEPPSELDFNDLEGEISSHECDVYSVKKSFKRSAEFPQVENIVNENNLIPQISFYNSKYKTVCEKKREDEKKNLEVAVMEPLINIDLENYKLKLNNLRAVETPKTSSRHVCLRSGLTNEEFKAKLFAKSTSQLEWKESSLAPLRSNMPLEKRKSLTEIIEAISKSQTMLREAGNKKDSLALSKEVF
ncbi:uncharacterized protein LOC119662108 [Teleopsis dalmanni]|uniref:uncharacterized protein LOC119662108 n=1 Tax=Teleopsis dalmanni TaxID=139649 RepID=UPI0018CDC953|nr:uncharacterized protein LOC119662108 [Teleopsis dalmanni]